MINLPTPAPQSVGLMATSDTRQARAIRLHCNSLRRVWITTAWGVLAACSLLIACGGGGGGGASPAATPPPPAPPPPRLAVTLSAEEDLAWKSFALRTVGVDAVTDTDSTILAIPYFGNGRFDFAGLYPTGTGTAGQSNVPSVALTTGVCKDGGNRSVSDLGDSFTYTDVDCKDGNVTLNGTTRFDYQTVPQDYPKPNDSAIKSLKGMMTVDRLVTQVRTDFTFTQSPKGQIEADISENTRVTRYKNFTYVVDGVTVISNLVLTIKRSTQFGDGVPFSLTSMTGSLTVDGASYQVTSSPDIAWKKTSGYLPIAGDIIMTAPNGDRLVSRFTNKGVTCGVFPPGTTIASLVVTNCSRL